MKKLLLSNGFVLCAALFVFAFFSVTARAQFISRPTEQPKPPTGRQIRVVVTTSGAPRPATVQNTNFPLKSKIGQSDKIATPVLRALNISALERRVLELVNNRRSQYGLPPIAWSGDAARVARLHSQNMAAFNFFSHQGRDGKQVGDRATANGLRKWHALGENIAYNRGYGAPLESAVQSWMNSAGHRENILNTRWEQSGVGIALTADGTYYFTEVFLKN